MNEKSSADAVAFENKNSAVNNTSAISAAEQTLQGLNSQISAMRSVLTRLLQDVVLADTALSNHHSVQMLEANEFLTLSALNAQTLAETSAMKLDEAALATGLDALTGLPNRVLLLARFEQAIQSANRNGTRLAMLFIDLDHFKQINDSFGHAVGDEVLQATSRCLSDAVRAVDTVSRHGGDEFLVLLAGIATAQDAVAVAEKVCSALSKLTTPSLHQASAFPLTASIGISIYPDHGTDSATLIERADAAMYRVKRTEAGGCALHDDGVKTNVKQALSSASRAELTLHHGLHRNIVADMQLRHLVLQEANEQLILSALSARDLQAAAERALQRQSEFLADVRQELLSPSAPIRIAASMLGRRRSDESLLPMAQAMVDQRTEDLARMVGAVLEDRTSASTVPRGRSAWHFMPVDLTQLVRSTLDSYRPELKRRSQHLEVLMPDANLQVSADPYQLKQAVSNLLSNATKYTRNFGVITVAVTLTPGQLILTVSDTGIGISAAILPKVFEPFVQDTHAIGFNGVGLGIGLTAVREVIEAHRGSVQARSAGEGQGSQFIVTLPRLNAV